MGFLGRERIIYKNVIAFEIPIPYTVTDRLSGTFAEGMHNMKKRFAWFPILWLLVLLSGCRAEESLAQTKPASAESGNQTHMATHEVLTLGNTPIVYDGKVIAFQGEGWQYDATSATLTLDSAQIRGHMENEHGLSALYCTGDLNILVSGENTIDISAASSNQSSAAVYVLGQLEISGPGRLTVSGSAAAGESVGIYALRGLTISGVEVAASGGSGDRSMGIASGSGLWLEKGASVQASGGPAKQFSAGVYTGQGLVSVQDSFLTADGGAVAANEAAEAMDVRSCGIWSASQVSLRGSTVTASGGSAEAGEASAGFSDGVYAVGNVEMDDSSRLSANGGSARGREAYSRGICCFSGNVGVYTGALNGYGGAASGNALAVSCGAYVEKGGFYAYEEGAEVTLTGGTAEAASETGKAYANGICAVTGDVSLGAGNAAIGGGQFTAAAGNSEGIFTGSPAA